MQSSKSSAIKEEGMMKLIYGKKNILKDAPCQGLVQEVEVLINEKFSNRYRVTVTYLEITAEEAKIKRAIIEDIIKGAILKS